MTPPYSAVCGVCQQTFSSTDAPETITTEPEQDARGEWWAIRFPICPECARDRKAATPADMIVEEEPR